MRSLEEWTKYLEQQEQVLEQTSHPQLEAEPPRVEKRPSYVPAEPERIPEPVLTVVQEIVPVPEPVVASPVFAVVEDVVAEPMPIEPIQAAAPEPIKTSEDRAIVRTAARLRKKMPKQLMAGETATGEVAQNSYSVFKETREELLQRLLDPQLTLEDTARILNVCPTTVRRYTNRGLLKHVRTAGNQRRFRLSDVLTFMEAQLSGMISESAE